MGIATEAGQNIANNARGLSLSDIIGHAAQTALGAVTGPSSPFALPAMLGRAGYDFGGGLAGASVAA